MAKYVIYWNDGKSDAEDFKTELTSGDSFGDVVKQLQHYGINDYHSDGNPNEAVLCGTYRELDDLFNLTDREDAIIMMEHIERTLDSGWIGCRRVD